MSDRGVTFPPYRFFTIAEAANYAEVPENRIRARCRIIRDVNGERVSEDELLRKFGINRKET